MTGSAGADRVNCRVALLTTGKCNWIAVCDDAEWFNRRVMSDWQASMDSGPNYQI